MSLAQLKYKIKLIASESNNIQSNCIEIKYNKNEESISVIDFCNNLEIQFYENKIILNIQKEKIEIYHKFKQYFKYLKYTLIILKLLHKKKIYKKLLNLILALIK